MSILKSLQEYLSQFDGMELRPIDTVLTDRTEQSPSSYAVAPAGNSKITEDVLGNKTFQNSYVFYARECADLETDRAETHDFLEIFSDWLDDRNDADILPELPGRYKATRISVSNAMLFDIDDNGNGTYQVQIQLFMTKEAN